MSACDYQVRSVQEAEGEQRRAVCRLFQVVQTESAKASEVRCAVESDEHDAPARRARGARREAHAMAQA